MDHDHAMSLIFFSPHTANAFVRIDLNDILEDGSGSASYFMLIESIIRHFSLPKTVELTLFLNTHGGQLREIAHDLDLSEQLSLASNASSFIHIQIVDAVVSIGKRGKHGVTFTRTSEHGSLELSILSQYKNGCFKQTALLLMSHLGPLWEKMDSTLSRNW